MNDFKEGHSTAPRQLEGRAERTEEECNRLFARCPCAYELWRGDRRVSSCVTRAAHEAARRLLEMREAKP